MTNLYEWVEGAPPPATPDETPPAAGPGGEFDGAWTTSEGAMTLTQSGALVSGTYSTDNGRIAGEAIDGAFAGYWAEDGSNVRCETERLGSFYWGRVEWTLSAEGTAFEGGWSYCDSPISGHWTGTR